MKFVNLVAIVDIMKKNAKRVCRYNEFGGSGRINQIHIIIGFFVLHSFKELCF